MNMEMREERTAIDGGTLFLNASQRPLKQEIPHVMIALSIKAGKKQRPGV
jgi:hypothetical protein